MACRCPPAATCGTDQFVLVGVDERAAGVSGCSIDALVRRMQQLEGVLGLELVNNAPVLYREGDAIERVSRERFAELAASGTVGPNTRVFDNTLTRVGDLLAGKWEVKAADAWHATLLLTHHWIDWQIGRLTEC